MSDDKTPCYDDLRQAFEAGYVQGVTLARQQESAPDDWATCLRELVDAMKRYEMEADTQAPYDHRRMMAQAESLIAGVSEAEQLIDTTPVKEEPDPLPSPLDGVHKLAEFGRRCFEDAITEGGDVEWDVAFEHAQAIGLLEPEHRDQPCDDEQACRCSEVGVDFPTTCYRVPNQFKPLFRGGFDTTSQPPAQDCDECIGTTALDDSVGMLATMLIEANTHRQPDFIIGDREHPYLLRWWLNKEADASSVYLHQILRDDDDRALHDHPWDSTSIVLKGVLRERYLDGRSRELGPGTIASRKAEDAHRLEIVDGPVWTLFITGQRRREWGFYCPQGWRHWKDFVDPTDPGQPGPGCD